MQVDLYFTPNNVDEMMLRGKTAVMIDVLRASTSITAALANGAKEIIPVTTVESAVKISGNLFGDVILLGGERNGRMIEGFNLGNSPAEYSEERVKGKSIIFSSTNGSQAMVKGRYAREMLVGSFVNISMVVDYLSREKRDMTIVCAGKNGAFSMEDTVCAGMLLQKLSAVVGDTLILTDAATAAVALFKTFGRSILKMIKNSEHGRYLAEIGFAEDLVICSNVDAIPILPLLVGSVVRIRREAEKKTDPKLVVTS